MGNTPPHPAYGVDCRNATEMEEMVGTLQAAAHRSLNSNAVIRQEYVVRRLMPVECARLQGMPDDWCDKVLHKDAPEYKLWGNGMAFPCILYVVEGAADLLKRRQLSGLLGGGGR